MAKPVIIATDKPVLVDQRIKITAINLAQFQYYTFRVEIKSQKPEVFESYGQYIADSFGEIDLTRDASFGGTYKGVDGMGLFWSMVPAPYERKGSRFTAWDVATPLKFNVQLYSGHITSLENILEEPLATKAILRTYLSENVERIEVAVGRLRGTLFVPKGNKRLPGVLDMFGGHGGLLEYRAALLASHGFVTFALAFYAYKDLPSSFIGLDLDYFIEAVEWFSRHQRVCQNGIGYIGVSYGAQVALQVSSECNLVSAVVAISAPHAIYTRIKYKGRMIGLARELNEDEVDISEDGVVTTRGTWGNLTNEFKDIEIPIENIKGKILLVSGDDDQSIDTKLIGRIMQERLLRCGRPPLKHLHYPKTGHLIELPYMPMCSVSFHKIYSILFGWGGSIIEHSAAQEHSWRAVVQFLKENVKEQAASL
eukprot:Seg1498.1_Seg1498.2 transcript_id=Seg1498.1_Seg1498.2/GoldUCD/mRNA.D3Y31 product="Bile acid-CoA:amino acid N-acyltransferase" protein_id=Seg1498.1_Seg1498.2/GoldUCD/D3Y31